MKASALQHTAEAQVVYRKALITQKMQLQGLFISQKREAALVLSPPYPFHSRPVVLLLLLCRVLRCRILRIYIFFPFATFVIVSLFSGFFYLVSIGSPQHLISPLPPLVTTSSLPHFLQVYFFPIWFAMIHLLAYFDICS